MNAVARPTLAASPSACVARRTAAVRKPAAARSVGPAEWKNTSPDFALSAL